MCRVNHCFKEKPPKHNSSRFNILCHGKNKISPGPHHKKEVQHSRPVLPLYSEARPLPPFQPIPLLRASSSLKAPYPQANDHPHHRPLGASLSCTTARSKCQQAEQQPLDHYTMASTTDHSLTFLVQVVNQCYLTGSTGQIKRTFLSQWEQRPSVEKK